ncbi:MAG: nitroreductase family protein [Capsulimonadaceae bacterium]
MSLSNPDTLPIHDLLRNRRSHRALVPAPIEPSAILRLLEAARWAPSARNEQPWRFVVVRRDQEPQFSALVEGISTITRSWAKSASVLIAVIAKTTLGDIPNPYALYDCGQAVAHLTVQAQAEGLSVRQIGSFDKSEAAACLEVPAEYDTFLLLALGTPGDPNDLPEEIRFLELAPRTRKDLAQIAFSEKWNQPLA